MSCTGWESHAIHVYTGFKARNHNRLVIVVEVRYELYTPSAFVAFSNSVSIRFCLAIRR